MEKNKVRTWTGHIPGGPNHAKPTLSWSTVTHHVGKIVITINTVIQTGKVLYSFLLSKPYPDLALSLCNTYNFNPYKTAMRYTEVLLLLF